MVKSLISIFVTLALLAGLALFEGIYVDRQFTQFGTELETLIDKTEAETANVEDAKAVRESWESKKEHLHVWSPHNDISRIDYYMSETVRLIAEQNYSLALSKLEVLTHLTKCLPDTYLPALENIM